MVYIAYQLYVFSIPMFENLAIQRALNKCLNIIRQHFQSHSSICLKFIWAMQSTDRSIDGRTTWRREAIDFCLSIHQVIERGQEKARFDQLVMHAGTAGGADIVSKSKKSSTSWLSWSVQLDETDDMHWRTQLEWSNWLHIVVSLGLTP
jgi:hypothetical protein